MQNIFDKRKEEIKEFNNVLAEIQFRNRDDEAKPIQVPDGIMVKCPSCERSILSEKYVSSLFVCPNCGFHARLHAKERIEQLLTEYEYLFTDLEEKYMDFPNYEKKLNEARKTSGNDESIICAKGKLDDKMVLLGVMDSFFMMGSMGSVCGEKIALLCEKAINEHLPVILFTCSGGARMQEGVISLFQMAKTSQAIGKLKEHELYIAVLTDPTTGGVSASFASLADITLAEPKSLIGFAGKRVIEKTIKEVLPRDFQTSEFLLEKGYIDNIVERKDMKKTISLLLKLHNY